MSRSNRLASPGAPRTPGGGSAVAASEIARVVNAREPETALALAEEVLGRAMKIGATEAEVLVMAGDAALTRFANSEIHQNVVERSLTVNLRYIVGKRIAVVSTGKVDTDGLRSLVNRAAAIARSCEELEDWAGLPGPDGGSRPRVNAWSAGSADATPEFRADGVRAVIAAAGRPGVLHDAVEDVPGVGTVVRPREKRLPARELWIAFAVGASGTVTVDEGARHALLERSVSLLPAGVVSSTGRFAAGDAVEILGPDGRPFAKGLVRVDSTTLAAVAGSRTVDLPEGTPHEVVHRDDLVVLPS